MLFISVLTSTPAQGEQGSLNLWKCFRDITAEMPGEGPLESQCDNETDSVTVWYKACTGFQNENEYRSKMEERERMRERQGGWRREEGEWERKRKGTYPWGLALLSILAVLGTPARLFLPRVLCR